jgi:hypothetical protein
MGRWFFALLFGIFGIAGTALIISTVAGGDNAPSPLFTALWLAALGWNAYWWLFRIAYALRLEDDELVCEMPRGAVRLRLIELNEIRPMRFASQIEVIEHRRGRPVLVMAAKGLGPFQSEVSERRPDLPVRLGRQARLSERMPGWSGWRRY